MVNISFARLRVFLAVAQSESISIAAERLAISQPAVSATVTALQNELGVALIRRDGRGIRLTEAGSRLAGHARHLFAVLDDALEDIHSLEGKAEPRARVGAVATVAEHVLPQLLREIRRQHPSMEIELDVATRQNVWERLAAWEVHVVVAGRPPPGTRFRSIATRRHDIIVVAPPSHRVAPIDLAAATWLLREPGTGTRAQSAEFFADLGIAPDRQLTIGPNGAIRECVRAGLGVSLVSFDSVQRELQAGELVEVPTLITPMQRQWHIVINQERTMPPAAKAFIAALLPSFSQTNLPKP
ncbi:MAG: LysR family transcriptional regulator [Vulcanimicrobiaceae bacterium]